MRCGWRFGKSFLRAGLGCGHLTERQRGRPLRDRGPRAPSPPGAAEPEEDEPEAAHEHEQQPSRSTRPCAARLRQSGPGGHRRGPALPHRGTSTDGASPDGRLARGRRSNRRLTGPRGRRRNASCTRDSFRRLSRGRRCAPRGNRGDRSWTGTRMPTGDAARPSRGSARLNCRRRRSDRLGRGRSLLRRLLGRVRLRLAHRSRGQKRQRVDVTVRLRGQAYAEVDVRLAPLGLAARADRGHDITFFDRGARGDADRADVHERDRVPVFSTNCEAEPFARHLAGERDDAGCGSAELGARSACDVDPAMLAAGVRVALGRERSQDRAIDWPRPPCRRRAEDEREDQRGDQQRDSVA